MTRTPALLFSLGIPPQQRTLLGGDQPLNEVLYQRLLALIDVHPNANNYFAWQALSRSYVGPGDTCLPLYLQQSRYADTASRAALVTPVHANLRVFLESLPARADRCGGAAGFAGLDGAGRNPCAVGCDRSRRQ